MRVIEKQMVNAAMAQKIKFRNNNTEVMTEAGLTKVLLHGNTIAEIDWAGKLIFISNCGWETPTTKSRLNALLGAVKPGTGLYQKKGQWYLYSDGKEPQKFEKSQILPF